MILTFILKICNFIELPGTQMSELSALPTYLLKSPFLKKPAPGNTSFKHWETSLRVEISMYYFF